MKNLRNSLMMVALFSVTLFLSSFTPPNNGNGVIVEVVKGQVWTLTSCGGLQVPSQSSTTQYKNGVVHMRTLIFSLPEGHCLVQDKINKLEISGHRVIVTPGGMLIAKLVIN